jgi:hypothetical protein
MPGTLTSAVLDEVHEELKKHSIPLSYDEEGRPCYTIQFEGTEEEYKILKQKLSEL